MAYPDAGVGNMDRWELALLVVVGYLALTALVRLMIWHRQQCIARFSRELERQKKEAQLESSKQQPRRKAG